jgi:glutamate N-acetyltransferase/amino-acid N-acetyltransferase
MASQLPVSPLAPKKFPKLPTIEGISLATYATGSRYKGRDDLLLVRFAAGTSVAGVFTTSKAPSAAVDLSRSNLASSKGRAGALVVNAGIANAFTGKAGAKAAQTTAAAAAKAFRCAANQIFIASTGVIGADLDPTPLVAAIDELAADMPITGGDYGAAAKAIMTTDTFAKAATRVVKFGKEQVRINAIVKGSGMIAPDMATLLAFVFTDAAIPPSVLQKLLNESNAKSLNSITVDSDTSTSDTCLMFASGHKALGGAPLRSIEDKRLRAFRAGLQDIMQDIAVQTVSDGEGVSKIMTIDVTGAENDAAARRIGLAIGNSPLVKTAIAGEDANWGRIVMAIGKSGELVERDLLAIDIGGHKVARRGRAVAGFDEAPVARHMKGRSIHLAVNVGAKAGKGKGRARVWASDLTHGYISINADYRS